MKAAKILQFCNLFYCALFVPYNLWSKPIQITCVRNLVFSKAFQGDPAEQIISNSDQTSIFLISADVGEQFEIDSVVELQKMSKENFNINTRIWSSSPQKKVTIPTNGSIKITVSTIRESIALRQPPGLYQGKHALKIRNNIFSEHISEPCFHELQVAQAISIDTIHELLFPETTQGEGRVIVEPRSSQAARFRIQGTPGTYYLISLPAPHQIRLLHEGRTTNFLSISKFKSFPDSVGTLNQIGSGTLQVGAELENIQPNLPSGQYRASFPVRVTYQ